jgi:predicted AAA+ superfamily ATPase
MTTMIPRILREAIASAKKSVLLLGPRQVGKSTLMRQLAPDLEINLAHEPTFFEFAQNARELEQRLAGSRPRLVFIDEVQRLPRLLNTLQVIIDSGQAPRFLLTGSSARKLRRGRANLLPGRIHTYELAPLCAGECGYELDTARALATGTLPGVYTSDDERDRKKTLRSYAATYLKEEVQAEALTRNIEGFARFLRVAAACASSFLDHAKLAKEALLPRQTAVRFFEILEETLLVRRVEAFAKTERRRLLQHPRYFFFDNGVWNALLGNFAASPDRIGSQFEHLFHGQLHATAAARDVDLRISSYRTEHGAEVDFIVEAEGALWAIECKASRNVSPTDLRGLASFAEFIGRKKYRPLVAYLGEQPKTIQGVEVLPWQQVLRQFEQTMGSSAR